MSTLRDGTAAAKAAIAGEAATQHEIYRQRMVELAWYLEALCTCGHVRQRHTIEGPVQALREPCYIKGCECEDFTHADPQ
jgi:hypothetical protein